MIKLIFRFIALLTLLIGGLFSLHLFTLHFLGLPLLENQIITSYLVNFILAIIIFIVLIVLKDKYAESLGYIFFLGSFLKFAVFFILIYPSFKADGDVTRLEFISFFIPYAFCLTVEVIFLIKILNK